MMQLAEHEAAAVHAVPLPQNDWCLFLDVDGTLLELADSPGGVAVDAALQPLLSRLRSAARGAVALVSGRTIDNIDRLLGTQGLPVAGLHGCERRDARGALHVAPVAREQLSDLRAGLERLVARHPGLLLEDKGAGVALHFLKARELENELRAEVALLAAPLVPTFAILDGHAVIEVKPAAHTKDSAVTAFMDEPPFAGRMPIFIGDDQTDYGGFAAVRRHDGMAIAVGSRVKAEWWLPGPVAVRSWLELLSDSEPWGGARMNYGVIGNCQVAALIDEQARFVWACLPRPDGDPVFSALLQKEGGDSENGVFAIDMIDLTRSEQTYLRNSAIIETRLYDSHGGALRIVDFAPRFRSRGRVFRPMMFVRSVEPLAGRPTLRLRLRPTAGFGARCEPGVSGSHHVRFTAEAGLNYRMTTDASLAALLENRPIVLEQPLHFILGPDETLQESPAALTREFLGATLTYWQEWVRTLAVPADWQDAVIRAAITLKLCTYEDTGAVLAALTTSIPEAPNTVRNWDYRYCWLRDSYFVVQTLNRLGATRTMEAYLHFIDHIIATSTAGTLQPLYGITGDPRAEERIAKDLSGYRGMGPVRFGNLAAEQVQHDVYGSVILAATQLFFDERLVRSGDQTLLERLYRLGRRAVATFEEPDAGPWEFRGRMQRHTFSAAISWAGCDRLSRIARRVGDSLAAREWGAHATRMRDAILQGAWSEKRQAFTSAFGNHDLDATTLLLPELGLLPATDPRFLKTLERIEAELRIGGAGGDLLFRYKHADDFGAPENAFTICAFWYVNALAAAGRVDEARERFSRLLERRNPLGLLSEDIAPDSGELWGNFPQTYSMVGIIGSALRLSRSWEELV